MHLKVKKKNVTHSHGKRKSHELRVRKEICTQSHEKGYALRSEEIYEFRFGKEDLCTDYLFKICYFLLTGYQPYKVGTFLLR